MLVALGHADGLAPVVALLEAGLLIPELNTIGSEDDSSAARSRINSFKSWLSTSSIAPRRVIASPLAVTRALGEDHALPDCPGIAEPATYGRDGSVRESDGLEWLLRLAVLRQQVAGSPLRRTQQHAFFKRDLERLQGDPLLNGTPDSPAAVVEPALFTVALALAAGVLHEQDAELIAGEFSASWEGPLAALIADLWASLPFVKGWD